MTLKLYNTLSQKKETFVPKDKHNVKLYVCGPTVYDLLHIGNFRGAIFFNFLRHWLEILGYTVNYAVNFTDIDDKIIQRAHELNKDPLQLSEFYIDEYVKDYQSLSLSPHSINPKCTHHIPSMILFIENLIKKQKAYHVDGSVFFEVSTYKEYGKLSNKNIDDLGQVHRVDPDPRKKSPLDFILWKPAKAGEPAWDSPWGKGRPGWHIECSAMNKEIFGDQIDIHGGGIDLIFPHHENEIAQTEALTDKPFSTFWVHHNFIRFGDDKMSKSKGNVVQARSFIQQYHPEILKFLILSVHYRSEINFETKQIYQAISRLARIYKALKEAKELAENHHPSNEFNAVLNESSTKFKEGLNDDLNTPIAFAAIFELIRHFNNELTTLKKKNPLLKGAAFQTYQFIIEKGKAFSLFQEDPSTFLKDCDAILIKEKNINKTQIQDLIEKRNLARQQKDFALADSIRQQLLDLDIIIQDTPTETLWEVNKTLS